MSKILSLNGSDWQITGWWEKQWVLQNSMELNQMVNAAVQSIPGTVPGAVNQDLLKAGLLPDPNQGLNSLHGEWVSHREWFYDKTFRIDQIDDAEKYQLVFKGLDYHGEIYLNGRKIRQFEGMFLPVEIDVTASLIENADNFLRVVFYRSPEVYGQFGYSNQISVLKSRFNYVWDWCPRIVPTGIWDDVYLKAYSRVRINDLFPKTTCTDETSGEIAVQLDLDVSAADEYTITYEVVLEDKLVYQSADTHEMKAAAQQLRKIIQLEKVKKW